MEIEEYIKKITNISTDINESLKNTKSNSLAHKYIINFEKKFKDTLDLFKIINIDKIEIQMLKFQDDRKVLLDSNINKTDKHKKLIEINQEMINLSSLKNSNKF